MTTAATTIQSHSSWDSRSRTWQFACGGCLYRAWGYQTEADARDALMAHIGGCEYAQPAS